MSTSIQVIDSLLPMGRRVFTSVLSIVMFGFCVLMVDFANKPLSTSTKEASYLHTRRLSSMPPWGFRFMFSPGAGSQFLKAVQCSDNVRCRISQGAKKYNFEGFVVPPNIRNDSSFWISVDLDVWAAQPPTPPKKYCAEVYIVPVDDVTDPDDNYPSFDPTRRLPLLRR